jgi:hypothetical protein
MKSKQFIKKYHRLEIAKHNDNFSTVINNKE